jgi:hypothetical protein
LNRLKADNSPAGTPESTLERHEEILGGDSSARRRADGSTTDEAAGEAATTPKRFVDKWNQNYGQARSCGPTRGGCKYGLMWLLGFQQWHSFQFAAGNLSAAGSTVCSTCTQWSIAL